VGQRVERISERTAMGPMLAQHERALGAVASALRLDAGYLGSELLTGLAEREIKVLCPSGRTHRADWQRHNRGQSFDRREFVYEAEHERYRGPAGCELHFDYHAHRIGADAGACAIAARNVAIASCVRSAPSHLREGACVVTPVKRSGRRGRRSWRQPGARREYRRREVLLEPWFARLRGLQRLDRFRRRGLDAVRAESALHCIACNLRVAAHLIPSRVLLIISRAYPEQQPQPLAVLSPTFLYLDIR